MEEKYTGESLTFSKKLENFWYHYKIHTVAALFIIIVAVICIVQMCSKPSYDAHILYAGDERISSVRQGGDLSEYEKVRDALISVSPDRDGDGDVLISFLNLFVANEDELIALSERGESIEGVANVIKEDTDTLHFNMLSGDYYVMLLSTRIFLDYDGEYSTALFTDLSVYAEAADVEYVGDGKRGIKLSSLENFSELEGINGMDPEDTVLCLRKISDISKGQNKHEKNFAAGEAVIRKLLAYD